MKMKFTYTALFVAAVIISSCDKADTAAEIQPTAVPTPSTTISKTFGSIIEDDDVATTRSTINSDKRFRWESGDKINVFDNLGGKNQFTAGDPGASNAPSFTGTVTGSPTAFYALYPYDAAATWTPGTATATAYVPSYQGWLTETGGNAERASKLHLLGATESAGTLSFKNLTSIIHIKPGTGLNLYEIKIEMGGSGKIAGDCDANLSTRTVGSGSSNTVLIQKNGGINGGKDYYFVVLPTTERTLNVTFIKTDGTYQTVSKTLTNTSGIVAGKMIDFGEVTSSNLTSFAAFNYTKVTSAQTDWTGDYTFVGYESSGVADKKFATFGGSFSRRWYKDEWFTDANSKISAAYPIKNTNSSNTNCTVTLVKKGTGYYIMHQDKYITGTDSSDDLTLETTPVTGSLWTVVFDDESDSVHFTNTTGSRKFGYSSLWTFTTTASNFYLFKAEH